MKCICCEKELFQKYCETSCIGLPVYRCNNCGLYISGKNESEMKNKVMELYEGDYWDSRGSEEMIKKSYLDEYSLKQRVRWLSQIEYCKPFISNKKLVFEIGMGAGQFFSWFQGEGFDVTGLEPDERNVKLLKKILNQPNKIISGYAEDLDLDKKFDFVWASHVMEHTIRPDIVFQKIFRILKSDGYFFIEVPNCSNKSTLESSIHNNPSTFHFTQKSLLELGQRSGFKIIKSDFFKPYFSFKQRFKRRFKKRLGYSDNVLLYDRFLKTHESDGINLRVLCQKRNTIF